MWTDNETELDFLNFTGVADTVAEIVVQAQAQPISIGVSGAWGVGKSSMIRLIRRSLGRRENSEFRCPLRVMWGRSASMAVLNSVHSGKANARLLSISSHGVRTRVAASCRSIAGARAGRYWMRWRLSRTPERRSCIGFPAVRVISTVR